MNIGPSPAQSGSYSFAVPAGKRLVIEYFNATTDVKTGNNTMFHITTRILPASSRQDSIIQLPAIRQVPTILSGVQRFFVSERILCYADPNTNVEVTMFRGMPPGTTTTLGQHGNVQLAGYMIDVP